MIPKSQIIDAVHNILGKASASPETGWAPPEERARGAVGTQIQEAYGDEHYQLHGEPLTPPGQISRSFDRLDLHRASPSYEGQFSSNINQPRWHQKLKDAINQFAPNLMDAIKRTPPSSRVVDMTTPEATTYGGVMDEVTARKLANQVRLDAKLKAERDLWLQDDGRNSNLDAATKAEELIHQDAKDRSLDELQGDDLTAAQQAHEQYRRSVYEQLGLDPETGESPPKPARDEQSRKMSPEDLLKFSRHYEEAAQRASDPKSRKIFRQTAQRFRDLAGKREIRGISGGGGFMANSKGILPRPDGAY